MDLLPSTAATHVWKTNKVASNATNSDKNGQYASVNGLISHFVEGVPWLSWLCQQADRERALRQKPSGIQTTRSWPGWTDFLRRKEERGYILNFSFSFSLNLSLWWISLISNLLNKRNLGGKKKKERKKYRDKWVLKNQ